MVVAVFFAASVAPMPRTPRPAAIDRHEYDSYNRDTTFQLVGDEATPEEVLRQNRIVWWIGNVVVAALLVFVAFGLLRSFGVLLMGLVRHGRRLPRWFLRFLAFLDRLLQRLTRFPALPRFERRIRISRDVATCTRYNNPLADPNRAAQTTPAQVVEIAYQALCALAHDLGVPRRPGQTPYEFIEEFPKPLQSLRREAVELTHLYVRSAYSPMEVTQKHLDRVRAFWQVYERARSRIVR